MLHSYYIFERTFGILQQFHFILLKSIHCQIQEKGCEL